MLLQFKGGQKEFRILIKAMILHSTFIFFSFRSYHDILQKITIPAIYRLCRFALISILKLCSFDVVLVYHNPPLKKLNSWVNMYQNYSVACKLVLFTTIYALFFKVTEIVFEYAQCHQCGCRVYFGNVRSCIDAYTDRTAQRDANLRRVG